MFVSNQMSFKYFKNLQFVGGQMFDVEKRLTTDTLTFVGVGLS